MSKRFIDTNFFKSPFVRGLKAPLKSLYSFIICDCDSSGIWTADLEAASLFTGCQISEIDFDANFVETGKAISLENGKYFFPDFLEHQYPKGLCLTNPAHNNIIKELLRYSLIDEELKPLQSTSKGTKVMVKDKVEVMDKEMVKVKRAKKTENFELKLPYGSPQFVEAWTLLMSGPKWKNKPITALQASLNKLAKETESDAITMINNCTAGNWHGLVDLKPHEKENYGKQGNSNNRQADVAKLGSGAIGRLADRQNRNNGTGGDGSIFDAGAA